MKKLITLLIIIFTGAAFAESPPAEKARGVFIAFGVGPRLPISSFANSTDLGYGFNLEVSYTDNEYLPIFVFARVGFEQYPGSQDFYQQSEYSNFSTNDLPIQMGVRYYFAPLLENVALFMPIVEVSANLTYYQILHQFKPESGRANFLGENLKLGVSGGVGVSMFLLEIIASYNYLQSNQFLSVDLRARLPLFISY